MYKRINEPLLKNGVALFEIGDTSNEILGDASNWEEIHKGRFIPENGERYYYVDGDGLIDTELNHDSLKARFRISVGNCYHTKEEAKEALWRMQFETIMIDTFKPWECDWKRTHTKHYLEYWHGQKVLRINDSHTVKQLGVIHCNDEKVIKQFIKDNEQDLIRYFKGQS